MRKIVQATVPHNARFLSILAAAALLALFAGCQGGDQGDPTDAGTDCGLVIDTASWRYFDDLANQIQAGRPATDREVETFMAQKGMDLWFRNLAGLTPTTQNMANYLDVAFGSGERAGGKVTSNQRRMVRTFRYSHQHGDLVNKYLAEFSTTQACELDSLLDFWIDADKLPAEPLSVFFIPGFPETRAHNDSFIVDTGLLVAAGPDQMVHHLGALAYRNFMAIPGSNPKDLRGAESVAHTFRIATNEGIAGWIGQATDILFRDDHPKLGQINIIPEEFFSVAVEGLTHCNTNWKGILTDPENLERNGQTVLRWFMGQGAFLTMGYCMATTIEENLGIDRLREVAQSVPGFLAAYQEAALLNPVPQPLPGARGYKNHQSMPPLDPEAFAGLHGILEEAFPD